jgi:PAS domain S-box-containing protein
MTLANSGVLAVAERMPDIVGQGFASSLVEESPDALIALSTEGIVLFWNQGAETIFGYGRDEVVGKSIEDVIVPSDKREEARRKLAEVLVRGSLIFETTRRCKNGSFVVVDVSKRLVTDEHGQPLYIAVSKKDVTRLRHEAAVEAKFRALFEAAPDAMVVVGNDGRIVLMNGQTEKFFGYGRDELIGQPIEILIPNRFREGHAARRDRYLGDPQPRPMGAGFALHGRRKNGTEFAADISLSPVEANDGPLVFAAIRDITARREAEEALAQARATAEATSRELEHMREREARRQVEEALRQSEARFGRLAESGIIGILTTDVEGRVLDANDAYLKMIGYSREELVRDDVRWTELTPPELRHLGARAVDQLKASGVAPPWETESFRKDGSRVPILVGVAVLDYPRCIAFAADLSQRRRAEDEKALFAAEARREQAGREQAEALLQQTEEQLRHAQKMEAVGRLAGGVAHDFNNVLSVILSYSDLILGEVKRGEPIYGDIEEIRKAGERAASLTRQLLMFSRQQVLEPKVLDLNELLAHMDKMLRRLIGEDVELTSTPAASLGKVRADPGSIEQIIMNLAVNARDAMPRGGRLTIETANVTLDKDYARKHLGVQPGRHVLLAVSDTGSGMDRATQARIFEPFFTTKPKEKGTGLGLSTVFGIVQQSGGSVWVYSELGHGTTFKVYLPVVEAAVDEGQPQVAPMTLRGSETVLLVEDEEQVRDVARSILRRYGYTVIEARNGGEAFLLCEKHPGTIDLLLSDVVMPHMSGPELARRLATTRPTMKIICMSGYTDDAVVRHGALDAGIAFIQKPFTPDTLARKVRDVLESRRQTLAP